MLIIDFCNKITDITKKEQDSFSKLPESYEDEDIIALLENPDGL